MFQNTCKENFYATAESGFLFNSRQGSGRGKICHCNSQVQARTSSQDSFGNRKGRTPQDGDKTIAFVQKACKHCEQNPDIVPSFLDVEELKNDIDAFEQIRALYAPLSQVVDSLNDTMLLSGSDAYAGALVFYCRANE